MPRFITIFTINVIQTESTETIRKRRVFNDIIYKKLDFGVGEIRNVVNLCYLCGFYELLGRLNTFPILLDKKSLWESF
ncbi:hypothetical protein C5468_00370 [Photorhabdus luminescens subsp. mexicana]|uniref:Uncharacterized protein n=1 Tax=Photorhabdus luminescens subsp. mexicana TaxID=2100167 RepID=A0A4R4JP71_PHOLU|nr:hypothetical protein C5468_00370 [Photorhabdus luminescens subsp. mexicana]